MIITKNKRIIYGNVVRYECRHKIYYVCVCVWIKTRLTISFIFHGERGGFERNLLCVVYTNSILGMVCARTLSYTPRRTGHHNVTTTVTVKFKNSKICDRKFSFVRQTYSVFEWHDRFREEVEDDRRAGSSVFFKNWR